MVEPVHPLDGSELHRLGMTPGTTPADHLGFEEPDHRLGQGIVVTVADAADRRLDAGLGKPLGIADRDILGDSSGRRNTLGRRVAMKRRRRPMAADLRDDPRHLLDRTGTPVDVGRAQLGGQQMLAAEHVQR